MKSEDIIGMCESRKLRKFLGFLLILFTIHSTAGFILFVNEEAMQTAMFGAFAYQTAKDWDGLRGHIEVMEATHTAATIMTYTVGWFAPLMMPAYVSYLKTNEAYIDAAKARAYSHK